MEIVRLENLCRFYKKGEQNIAAVNGLNLTINSGDFIAVVGRSGSGKSTLLNLVGGLDTPTSGKIFIKGRDISGLSRTELARHRRFSVGMIFQSFNMIYSYNALQNVVLAMIFGGVPGNKRKEKATAILESVGLKDRILHTPDELSGGETQRVAIARALANEPDILLADEPTGNLDSTTAEDIIGLLVKLNRERGKTIIMVTHDIDLALRVTDRVIRLLDGRIIEDITTNRKNETA